MLLMTGAIAYYPGGNWFDPKAAGHRFWANFWCDLLHRTALNGALNPVGSELALAGMFSMAAGLVGFWLAMPELFNSERRLAGAVRALGVLSSLGLLAVVLLPSDRFAFLHGLLVTVSGPTGIAGAIFGVIGTFRSRAPRHIFALGAAMLLFASTVMIQYARQFWFHVAPNTWLPALQKITTLLLLAWILTATFEVHKGQGGGR